MSGNTYIAKESTLLGVDVKTNTLITDSTEVKTTLAQMNININNISGNIDLSNLDATISSRATGSAVGTLDTKIGVNTNSPGSTTLFARAREVSERVGSDADSASANGSVHAKLKHLASNGGLSMETLRSLSMRGYMLEGGGEFGNFTNLANTPNTNRGGAVYPGGDFIYALAGNATSTFWRYQISTNQWTTRENAPANMDTPVIVHGDNGFLYALGLVNANLYRYSISANTWTTMTAMPAESSWGFAMVFGDNGFIYAARGSSTLTFYRYSISENSWATMNATPGGVESGAKLFNMGNGTLIMARGSTSGHLWQYDIAGNTWTTFVLLPWATAGGCDIVYTGGKYLYIARGGTTHLARIDLTNLTFHIMQTHATVGAGFKMIYTGEDALLILHGNNTNVFRRVELTSVPYDTEWKTWM